MFNISGDGVFEQLYYLLWKKDGPYILPKNNYRIPQTVLINNGGPISWFFTSQKTGEIMKKKRSSLKIENILKEFAKFTSKCGIICYFIRKKSTEEKYESIIFYLMNDSTSHYDHSSK